eukprot:COSAG02_NODE_47013_length_344_cov_0.840816_1_plen_54_part_10
MPALRTRPIANVYVFFSGAAFQGLSDETPCFIPCVTHARTPRRRRADRRRQHCA